MEIEIDTNDLIRAKDEQLSAAHSQLALSQAAVWTLTRRVEALEADLAAYKETHP